MLNSLQTFKFWVLSSLVGLLLSATCGCMFKLETKSKSENESLTPSSKEGRIEIASPQEYVQGPILLSLTASVPTISINDFLVTNGNLSDLTGGPETFTVLLTPQNLGFVRITSDKFEIVEVSGGITFETSVFDLVYDNESPLVDQVNRVDPMDAISNSLIVLLEVSGATQGDVVTIYRDSLCLNSAGVAAYNGSVFRAWITETISGSYTYYAKAVDQAGNASPCSTASANYELDLNPPSVSSVSLSMFDPSANSGIDDTPTILVSGVEPGDSVSLFRDSQCLFEIASGLSPQSNINLTTQSLSPGDYLIYAKITDDAGNGSSCSTSSVSYKVNSTATPGNPQLIIEGHQQKIFVSDSNLVNLTILANPNDFSEMYITNESDCASGGVWEPYWPFKTGWALNSSQINGSASVYVKFRDASHSTESACFTDDILWEKYNEFNLCGATNNSSALFGVLYDSGGSSASYSNSENCSFTIQSSRPIQLNFESIYTERGDPIYVFDGDEATGTLLGIFFGYNVTVAAPFIANSGTITVKFTSNAAGTNPGFKLRWLPASTQDYSTFQINGGAVHSVPASVTLEFANQESLTQMYITSVPDCLGGGVWEPYSTTKPWTLSDGDGLKTIYAKFRDQFNHQTFCEKASIVLDTEGPTPPAISYMAPYGTTVFTPGIVIFPSIDLGLGVSHYQVRILLESDRSVVKDWTNQSYLKSSDNKVIYLENLNLTPGESYRAQIRAVDKLGRYSTEVESLTPWTVRSQLTLAMGSPTNSLGISSFDPRTPALTPRKVYGDYRYSSLASGYSHVCGIDSATHKARCWGSSAQGVLSRTDIVKTDQPVEAMGVAGGQALSFSQISADNYFSCGIEETTQYAYCWGSGPLGSGSSFKSYTPVLVLGVNGGPPLRFTKISVGNSFVCGIEAITQLAYCWGGNTYGSLGNGTNIFSGFPSPVLGVGGGTSMQFSKITTNRNGTSEAFACGIEATTNYAYCWGTNGSNGYLGNGGGANTNTPVAVLGVGGGSPLQFSEIVSSTSSTCALEMGTKKAYCWGSNGEYGLGNNTNISSTTPTEVLGVGGGAPLAFRSIGSGSRYSCGLEDVTYKMYCWGANWYGELGNGTTASTKVPAEVILPGGPIQFSSISVGLYHNCGIEKNTDLAYCWGSSDFATLGTNSTQGLTNWESLSGPANGLPLVYSQVSLSSSFGCGLELSTGFAYCWGANSNGQLGNTSVASTLTPVPVMGVGGGAPIVFSQIVTGNGYSCGIEAVTGLAYCWGYNYSGQLGDSTKVNAASPVAVLGVGGGSPMSFSSIATSNISSTTCGIQSLTQKAFCWGSNFNGSIGDNTTTDRTTPVAVLGVGGGSSLSFAALASGWGFFCGLEEGTGKAHCWGSASSGAYGNGPDPVFSKTPTPALGVAGGPALSFSQISTSYMTVCAIETGTGHPYCWGYNYGGMVDDSFNSGVYYPTAIPGPEGSGPLSLSSISVGSSYACGIENGTEKLFCWGSVPFSNNNKPGFSAVTPYSLSGTNSDSNYLRFIKVFVGSNIMGIAR